MIKCALCGYEFDEQALACHSQCPMSAGCAILCCPNCGYQVVDESKAWGASLIKRALSRLRRTPARPSISNLQSPITTLQDLSPGQTAEVVEIASADPGRLLKLSALGIAPGSRIKIEQQQPVCIIWIGETQLSLDDEVAREIHLQAAQ
jgi:Fe2+ transport system protein FeoA